MSTDAELRALREELRRARDEAQLWAGRARLAEAEVRRLREWKDQLQRGYGIHPREAED